MRSLAPKTGSTAHRGPWTTVKLGTVGMRHASARLMSNLRQVAQSSQPNLSRRRKPNPPIDYLAKKLSARLNRSWLNSTGDNRLLRCRLRTSGRKTLAQPSRADSAVKPATRYITLHCNRQSRVSGGLQAPDATQGPCLRARGFQDSGVGGGLQSSLHL